MSTSRNVSDRRLVLLEKRRVEEDKLRKQEEAEDAKRRLRRDRLRAAKKRAAEEKAKNNASVAKKRRPSSQEARIPSYRTLTQNLYRLPLVRTVDSPDLTPCCECKPEDGCGQNCANRMLSMECAPGKCPSLREGALHCTNAVMQQRRFPKLEVFRTSDGKGWALRVQEDVGENEVLVEYLGEVITTQECLERMAGYSATDDFYFAGLGNGLMLDAKPMGSVARFANHSCEPNAELQKWTVLGEARIALVSTRELKAGSEITYNYGYFNDGLDLPRQKCLCGTKKCSGFVGGRVQDTAAEKWCVRMSSLLEREGGVPEDVLRKHVEDVLEALDKTSAAAVRSSNEFAKAQALLDEVEVYSQKVWNVLDRTTVPLSAITAKGLIEQAPPQVRTDVASVLSTRLKKAERLQRELAFFSPVLSGEPGADPLGWAAVVAYIKQAADAAPLLAGPVKQLLSIVWSTSQWALKHVAPNTADLMNWNHKSGTTSSALWPLLDRLGRLYDEPVSPLLLALHDVLEDRVERYLLRRELRQLSMNDVKELDMTKRLERIKELQEVEDDDLEGGAITGEDEDEDEDGEEEEDEEDEEKNSDEEVVESKLYCVCWLPEKESEPGLGVMASCDACRRWFHLGCIHAGGGDTKKDKAFVCPLCLHARHTATFIAREPHKELDLPMEKTTDEKKKTTEKSKGKGNSKGKGRNKAKGKGMNARNQLGTFYELKKRLFEESGAGLQRQASKSKSTKSKGEEKDVLTAARTSADARLLPTTFSRVGFTSETLAMALTKAQTLPITDIPVTRMLQLMETFQEDWRVAVGKELALAESSLDGGVAVALKSKTKPIISTEESDIYDMKRCVRDMGPERATSTDVQVELQTLQRLMWLYFQMRVVLLLPSGTEMTHLRRCMWRVHARAIARNILRGFSNRWRSAKSSDLVFSERIKISHLGAVLDGGKACDAQKTAEFKVLQCVQVSAVEYLEVAAKLSLRPILADGTETAVHVWDGVRQILKGIDTESDFAVLYLQSFVQHHHKAESGHLCYCGSSLDDDWICCDGCSSWSHIKCSFGVAAVKDKKKMNDILTKVYTCMKCCHASHIQYSHAWPSEYTKKL